MLMYVLEQEWLQSLILNFKRFKSVACKVQASPIDILLGSLIPTTLFGTCANPPAAETITPSVSKCLLGHVKKPFGGIRKEDLETRGNSYLKIVDDNTRTLPS